MSQAIVTELFDVAPELETEDVDGLAKIDRWIARAAKHVAIDLVGDEYDLLVAYKTAHLMTQANRMTLATAAGALLKEKGDNVEYTFANQEKRLAEAEKVYLEEFERRIAEIGYIEEGPV